jgi:imidazolonepropionase
VRAAALSRRSLRRGLERGRTCASALPRLDALIGEGVTTVEIKSGYGLNTEPEMRQLSAAHAVGRNRLRVWMGR